MKIRWLRTTFEYNNWRRILGKPSSTLELQVKNGNKWENIPVERVHKFV